MEENRPYVTPETIAKNVEHARESNEKNRNAMDFKAIKRALTKTAFYTEAEKDEFEEAAGPGAADLFEQISKETGSKITIEKIE